MSNGDWIVVDLDGTLSDCSQRVHLAEAKEWDAFHAGIPDDKPHPDVVYALNAMIDGDDDLKLIIVTGRGEEHAEATRRWLTVHGLDFFDQMLFRPRNDRTADHELKPRLLAEFFGTEEAVRKNVKFVLEDRDRVTESLRNMGLSVWQVRAGAF